jgi:lipoprotein-releasing system ATP-binding protein
MSERARTKAATPVVVGEKIFKSYPSGEGKLDVLLGLDISISKGEVVTLVGPSGSGKSTLLHILGALDKPTKGRVLLGGQDVWRLSDVERSGIRNRRVGFVFQFHHLLPEFTALENIMMSLLIYGMVRKMAEKKSREMLSLLGLAGRAGHYPSQLSGGEAQRVAVGRAVVGSPDIVLADEPSGNLDTASKAMLHDLILQLNREFSTTFLIATHNEQLAGLGGRTLHLSDGVVTREVQNS